MRCVAGGKLQTTTHMTQGHNRGALDQLDT